jgi:hypothetical protein
MLITRKCTICKQLIQIENEDIVYNKEKYFHFNCFINSCLRKKRNKLSKEELIIQAKNLQKENYYIIKNIIDKAKLYYWIQHTYNLVVLPSYFFIKMDNIYDGNYKGLSKGIPAEDILDMWQRKKNELDKIADTNKKKDKYIDGIGRINYDLAILLNKYDSYLKWKDKQRLFENDENQKLKELQQEKINFNNVNKIIDTQQKNENSINNLIDEIFD